MLSQHFAACIVDQGCYFSGLFHGNARDTATVTLFPDTALHHYHRRFNQITGE
jgi:hypothetical protein